MSPAKNANWDGCAAPYSALYSLDTAIRNFISAVERLENYSFITTVTNQQTGWMGTFANTEKMEQILIEHNREEVDATLLIVRQFIQNNDSISIANITTSAKEYLNDSANETMQQIRDCLNNELNSYLPIGFEGMDMSYRKILNAYLYGEHAHTSDNERPKYEALQETQVHELFNHYFIRLYELSRFILSTSKECFQMSLHTKPYNKNIQFASKNTLAGTRKETRAPYVKKSYGI